MVYCHFSNQEHKLWFEPGVRSGLVNRHQSIAPYFDCNRNCGLKRHGLQDRRKMSRKGLPSVTKYVLLSQEHYVQACP